MHRVVVYQEPICFQRLTPGLPFLPRKTTNQQGAGRANRRALFAKTGDNKLLSSGTADANSDSFKHHNVESI